MADPGLGATSSDDVPFMQQILDNMWLLLVLGNVVPIALYCVWGVLDALAIPALP